MTFSDSQVPNYTHLGSTGVRPNYFLPMRSIRNNINLALVYDHSRMLEMEK